ncbi:MAG: hypothetical protein ACM3ZE_28375 [Myxococcales bacterium]
MKHSPQYLWPVLAILAAGVVAWVTQPHASAYPAASVSESQSERTSKVRDSPETAQSEALGERVEGEVAEIINVPSYTYLRIAPPKAQSSTESRDVWVAVATAQIEMGQKVAVVGAQRMNDFTNKTLNRTFGTIYFGALEAGTEQASRAKLPKNHPNLPDDVVATPDADRTELPVGHPPIGLPHPDVARSGAAAQYNGSMDAPHGAPAAADDQIAVGKVERASGALGHTVSEVVQQRSKLVGKQVRVRGVVVKSMSGILGMTFAHIRDGSGKPTSSDHDLTVTSRQDLSVGATVTLEGTVIVDKDFGAGYTYPVLLEAARLVDQ